MTWNYRIIRKTVRVKIGGKSKSIHRYDLHEVYYNAKGKPTGWTQDPVDANGYESIKEMREVLCRMLMDALQSPPLEISKDRLIERR